MKILEDEEEVEIWNGFGMSWEGKRITESQKERMFQNCGIKLELQTDENHHKNLSDYCRI